MDEVHLLKDKEIYHSRFITKRRQSQCPWGVDIYIYIYIYIYVYI